MQREPDYAARPEAKLEAVLGWLLSDGDLFAPGNPVESPGEMGLRLEGANSFHAASRPRRRAFSLRKRVLGRRGSGHGAGWYIWSTDAAATPSSVAPGQSARRAHRRPGRSGGAAQQRSWALHSREKPSTEVASSGISSGPVSTCHSQYNGWGRTGATSASPKSATLSS